MASQPVASAAEADATSLLLHLEDYLGRLINLVDGGASGGSTKTAPTTTTTTTATSGLPPAVSSAPSWLSSSGPPPDTRTNYSQSSAHPTPQHPPQGGAAAEKFLKDLEQLIKTFLAQQHLDAGAAGGRPTAPGASPPATSATAAAPPPPLSKEAEARAEVLRKAVVAADADAAAKELRIRDATGRPTNQHSLLKQIDQQWDATLAENNALKAQLGQANHQQERLLQAKQSVENLLQQKETLLGKIRDAIMDLKKELAIHKTNLEQQAHHAKVAQRAIEDEKQAMIQKLRAAIADLENQLARIRAEKMGLEAELERTIDSKRAMESQLHQIQDEKDGLQHDLSRTHDALRTHQNIKNTLDKSFQNAQTEVQALRSLLHQLEPTTTSADGGAGAPTSAPSTTSRSAFEPAFRTTTTVPPVASYHVETVYDEPPPPVFDGPFGGGSAGVSASGGKLYDFQQHQAPWQEPSKQVWEGPPKQHSWEPITTDNDNKPPVPSPSQVLKIPYGGGGGLEKKTPSPEWSQQQHQSPATMIHRNYNPPVAENASVNGGGGRHQPPPAHQQQQQSSWGNSSNNSSRRGVDPAAVDGTDGNSYGYTNSQSSTGRRGGGGGRGIGAVSTSSGGSSVGGLVSNPAAAMLVGGGGLAESIDEASYSYDGSAPPHHHHHQYHQDNNRKYYYPQGPTSWNNGDVGVGSGGGWMARDFGRTPQEPPMTISTTTPQRNNVGGRMAYLQEQMANAVDDARNNPTGQHQQQQRPQPPMAKLPLQPPPAGATSSARHHQEQQQVRGGTISPERVVPAASTNWSTAAPHTSASAARMPSVQEEYKRPRHYAGDPWTAASDPTAGQQQLKPKNMASAWR